MEKYVKKQVSIVIILYFGELSVGYLTGWGAPAILKLQNPEENLTQTAISNNQASILLPLPFLGIIIGAQVAGCFANFKGRKPSLLLGGSAIMISFLIFMASTELWMMMVARLIAGIGGGMVFIVNLAYIAEISSTNIRGTFLTGTGIANAAGLQIGYCIGPFVPYRVLNYIGFFLALVCTAGALFIPETPAFYVMKGKEIEAKTTLVLLGRRNDIEDVLSSKPLTSRRQECMAIYKEKSNRKAMMIATFLLLCQQASGFVSILLFGTSILQSVGSSISPELGTIFIGMMQLVGSLITPMFVERVGRKILMLVTTSICFLSLIISGVYFYLESLNRDLACLVHWLPLVSLMSYILSYTIGFGIVPGTWMSEMFSSSGRGPGSATAMTCSWIVGFLVTSSFEQMTSRLGSHWTLWIYSVSCAMAFVFTALVVPETKGKSLSEIQYILSK